MVNPLTRCVEDYSLPPYAKLQVAHLVPAVRAALVELALDLNAIEDDLSDPSYAITWASVMDRLEIIDDPINRLDGVLIHLATVADSPEMRAAKDQVRDDLHAMQCRRDQCPIIFQAMQSLRNSATEWTSMTPEQQRILDRTMHKAKLKGVGLSDKDRFNADAARLNALRAQFMNNKLDATKITTKLVLEKDELRGVPASIIAVLAQNAVAAGHVDATPDAGPFMLSLDPTVYSPVMAHCSNRSLREEMYRLNAAKAALPPHDNAPVIADILLVRHQQAKMLGFNSFAEMSLSEKMAPSVQAVQDMLADLRSHVFKVAVKEADELAAFAAASGHAGPLEPWDEPFWVEKLRRERFDVDNAEIMQYFPLARVLVGMFELTAQLFGIQIEMLPPGQVDTWHPDVQVFQIRAVEQPDAPVIAHFFLDPYSRPGVKRSGSWMDTIVTRSRALRTDQAPVRRPVFSLNLNLAPPVGGTPSLMSFMDVEHLFSSFGYGLRLALTQAEHSISSALDGVEWDAVEVTSQFFSRFCFSRETLPLISAHFETGATMPVDMLEKLVASKHFRLGTDMLRQLHYAAIDLALYHDYDPSTPHASPDDIFDIDAQLAKTYCVTPSLPNRVRLCSLSHIFAGSYCAGYYSYLWSEVLAADAYACFDEAAHEPSEWRAVGRKFRDTYLAQVGVCHPTEAFKLFRGRLPTRDAFLQRYGLATQC